MPYYRCFNKTEDLPEAYKHCNYISFIDTNKAYISVGSGLTGSNIGVELKFRNTRAKESGHHVISGAIWAVARDRGFFVRYHTKEYATSFVPTANVDYYVDINTPRYPEKYAIWSDSMHPLGGALTVYSLTNGKLVFGAYSDGTDNITYNFNGYIYYCKIYNGEKIIYDFIPAIRKSDNKPGLFDKANKRFYSGYGTILAG